MPFPVRRAPQCGGAVKPLFAPRLHVRLLPGAGPEGPVAGRHYTCTHSDLTGDLFLTIGPDYDHGQYAGWYARLLRDEVLAEWRQDAEGTVFHVNLLVCGEGALGPARWRNATLCRILPAILRAFRFGDERLFAARPELDDAPIRVHFHAPGSRYQRTEGWGTFRAYHPECAPARR